MTETLDAAAALAQVDAARRRGAEMRGYAGAGRHLIAWGLVWLVGNLSVQFVPQAAWWIWIAAIAAVVPFQIVAGGKRSDWRVLATVATGLGFYGAASALLGVPQWLQSAFGSLIVAAIYVGLGIWTGARFAWIGLGLAAIILVARFAAPEWLPLAIGLGAGGVLIVSGLWLHRA